MLRSFEQLWAGPSRRVRRIQRGLNKYICTLLMKSSMCCNVALPMKHIKETLHRRWYVVVWWQIWPIVFYLHGPYILTALNKMFCISSRWWQLWICPASLYNKYNKYKQYSSHNNKTTHTYTRRITQHNSKHIYNLTNRIYHALLKIAQHCSTLLRIV